jgi:hypothetical protein
MSRTPGSIWFAFIPLAMLLAISVPSVQADVVNPSISGYAYLEQSAGPDLWTVGNVFTIVTIAQPGDLAIIPLDDTVNQYTVVLEDAQVASYLESGGRGYVRFETGMLFSVYEDSRASGSSADFGSDGPPNAVSPSSFMDGTRLAYSGTESGSFELIIHLASGTGYFVWWHGLPITNCVLLGPGFLGYFQIYGEVVLQNATPPVQMPAPDYVFQLWAQSDCDDPTQDQPSTWGELKALYR